MSFIKHFLKGEVPLWKAFWFVSFQPFMVIICEMLYQFFLPRPIYPDAYLYTSIIVRLACVIFYLLLFLVLVYGTWKSTNNYEGARVRKWLARIVLLANALMLCIGLFVNSMELAYVNREYFPHDFKSSE